MTSENTLRTPLSVEERRAGIHLVHSRSWQPERRRQAHTQVVPARPVTRSLARPAVRHTSASEQQAPDLRSLAAAALTAPFIWIGHATLRAMHII